MAKTTCKTIKTQIYRYKTILIHIEQYKTRSLCDSVTVCEEPIVNLLQKNSQSGYSKKKRSMGVNTR